MSGRLCAPHGELGDARRTLTLTVAVAVHDRGPAAPPSERYEAELVGFAAVREAAASPWEAVRALVRRHPTLLERRWAPGGPAS